MAQCEQCAKEVAPFDVVSLRLPHDDRNHYFCSNRHMDMWIERHKEVAEEKAAPTPVKDALPSEETQDVAKDAHVEGNVVVKGGETRDLPSADLPPAPPAKARRAERREPKP